MVHTAAVALRCLVNIGVLDETVCQRVCGLLPALPPRLIATALLHVVSIDDSLTLTNSQSGAVIDLGAGTNTLTLSDGGNAVTVAGVATLIGGAGTDVVTISGPAPATVIGVETLIGSSGDDAITLASAVSGACAAVNTDRFAAATHAIPIARFISFPSAMSTRGS